LEEIHQIYFPVHLLNPISPTSKIQQMFVTNCIRIFCDLSRLKKRQKFASFVTIIAETQLNVFSRNSTDSQKMTLLPKNCRNFKFGRKSKKMFARVRIESDLTEIKLDG